MKAIELTQSQIKALENGASMIILPIVGISIKNYKVLDVKSFIYDWCILQKGDKFFIQEDFVMIVNDICEVKQLASQMTYEQSRFKDLECVDVRVVRVQTIANKGYFDGANINEKILKGIGLKWIGYMSRESYQEIGLDLFKKFYHQQMQEQNINRTYEDNDYVFLVEFKR